MPREDGNARDNTGVGSSGAWPCTRPLAQALAGQGGREPDGKKQAGDVTLHLGRASHANSPRKEYYFDLQDDRGQIGITGVRCFSCGEVIDPVILHHRLNQARDLAHVVKRRKYS